jgi:hypothetical protein
MPKLNDVIGALEKGGNITISGQLFQEDDDSITLQIGGSLIDIPKESVLTRRDSDVRAGAREPRNVDVTVTSEAKIMQRIPATASSISAFGGGIGQGGLIPSLLAGGGQSACACACNCNCACECACSSKEEMAQFLQTMAFRNPMIPMSRR